jgi:hypothetical protein
MAIAYRGGGSNSSNGSTATTVVVTMSSTAQSGDYLIATVNADSSGAVRSWPAGFTERGLKDTNFGDGGVMAWADYVAGASEPSTYTLGTTSNTHVAASVVAYSGVDNTTPRDVTPTSLETHDASSTVFSVPTTGLASGSANRWLVFLGGLDNSSSGTVSNDISAQTTPATWTERVDKSSTDFANIAVCDVLDSAGTFTSAVTSSQTNTGSAGIATALGFLIALRSATGGGGANWLKQGYWWNHVYGNGRN